MEIDGSEKVKTQFPIFCFPLTPKNKMQTPTTILPLPQMPQQKVRIAGELHTVGDPKSIDSQRPL